MDIRQLIQLKQKGYSNRQVGSYLGIGRNTVNEYVQYFEVIGKSYEELSSLDDASLYDLFPKVERKDQKRYDQLSKQFGYYKKELSKPGCTLQHLWYEYRSGDQGGYGYTQFVSHYRSWAKKKNISGILHHKSAEKLFVDFAGKKLSYIDRSTGEVIEVEVFVAILPCSQFTYVQAVHSQKREDLITCINDCLQYIGGVPQAIVSDNLKSAVNQGPSLRSGDQQNTKGLWSTLQCRY